MRRDVPSGHPASGPAFRRLPPTTATTRRALLAGGGMLAAGLQPAWAASEWEIFRGRFVTRDGRVVDTGNGNVSHSEGQGWGMMFAASSGDRATFDRLWTWTDTILRRRTDRLFSWRYRPGARPAVEDPNNASDGDLYIAWGLLMAHQRWNNPNHRTAAVAILKDLLRLTRRDVGERVVLLPGAHGFETPTTVTLNPSYIFFPALTVAASAAPDPAWEPIIQDGLDLLRRARFGAWGLSPDWLLVPKAGQDDLEMPDQWPKRFSFDAVRVPLALAWAGETGHPALTGAQAFWTDPRWGQPPAWVDLESGMTAEYAAPPGMRAIAAFAAARISGASATIVLPPINASQDYYSASLTMLVRLASVATGLRVD